MDLYEVSSRGVKLLDVKKETKCGWRQHNNGFINRSELRKYSRYTGGKWFYTTSKSEALEWARVLHKQMHKDIMDLEESIRENK
ncbi:conserved hypothetical protein [Vibrio phage 249E41-1]|nr:conserved hypothetical protein [Vibrio phage 249E41-1]